MRKRTDDKKSGVQNVGKIKWSFSFRLDSNSTNPFTWSGEQIFENVFSKSYSNTPLEYNRRQFKHSQSLPPPGVCAPPGLLERYGRSILLVLFVIDVYELAGLSVRDRTEDVAESIFFFF